MFGKYKMLLYLAPMLRMILKLLNKQPDVSQGEYNQLLEAHVLLMEENIKLQIENQNLRRLHQN